LVFSGGYVQAEEAFGGVARILPLAEVVNNQGVAASRQGHDGVAFFRQAVAADPNSADYHFNLAVSLHRQKMVPEALTELATCLRLRPYDTEAQALETDWKVPAATPAPRQDSASSAEAKADPLERISRNFDAAAFHQAAMMLDQVDASRLAALTPSERAQKLATQARSYLESGLLLEAERLYLTAVADDNKVAEAHAGLAEVRERTGDETAARKEAVASLELLPSANAYLVLGRLDLSGGDLDQAGKDVDEALKLAPADKAAEKLRKQIEAKRVEKK